MMGAVVGDDDDSWPKSTYHWDHIAQMVEYDSPNKDMHIIRGLRDSACIAGLRSQSNTKHTCLQYDYSGISWPTDYIRSEYLN